MTYEELIEKRYELVVELADVERQLLKYNQATLFVEKKKRKARVVNMATPLPEDYWPPKELLVQASQEHQGLQVGIETEKFKNYYISHGKKLKNWNAAWLNWLIKASQYKEERR